MKRDHEEAAETPTEVKKSRAEDEVVVVDDIKYVFFCMKGLFRV